MLRLILLSLISPNFAQAEKAKFVTIVECRLERTDASVALVKIPLDDSLKDSDAIRSGSGVLDGLRIDYSSVWGPVPCEQCRVGYTKATTHTLSISRRERELEAFEFAPGRFSRLKKVRGFRSIECHIATGDDF